MPGRGGKPTSKQQSLDFISFELGSDLKTTKQQHPEMALAIPAFHEKLYAYPHSQTIASGGHHANAQRVAPLGNQMPNPTSPAAPSHSHYT
ncbi:hypothetical protein EUGRSUZ_C04387 [Eucalyptus grandis]|uniref:Uncharacterized protein n=2 Tax=Eucalyptus grandis TaxID=71139 RepID=A0ACC3LKC4_EUCGR|nr:hypothetical protein EUGRSUZ_C04387 [Eucalyptus grandis]